MPRRTNASSSGPPGPPGADRMSRASDCHGKCRMSTAGRATARTSAGGRPRLHESLLNRSVLNKRDYPCPPRRGPTPSTTTTHVPREGVRPLPQRLPMSLAKGSDPFHNDYPCPSRRGPTPSAPGPRVVGEAPGPLRKHSLGSPRGGTRAPMPTSDRGNAASTSPVRARTLPRQRRGATETPSVRAPEAMEAPSERVLDGPVSRPAAGAAGSWRVLATSRAIPSTARSAARTRRSG